MPILPDYHTTEILTDFKETFLSQIQFQQDLRARATAIFNKAIQAVSPEVCISRHLHLKDRMLSIGATEVNLDSIDRIFLIGAGKASAAMAGQAEQILGDLIHEGLVITKTGHSIPLERCRVMESSHPIPDQQGEVAAAAMLDLISKATDKDLVLALISGGASALAPAPAKGITLADKQETTRMLLECGADIHEINTIRKHLSRIKGGQLCSHASGARIIGLILSDVIGDDLDIIGSGMTAPDMSYFKDCNTILSKYGIWEKVPASVQDRIQNGIAKQIPETPKADSPEFFKVENHIVGSLATALSAAEKEASHQGFSPVVLSSMIQGEAREVAKVLCAVAKEVSLSGHPVAPPACILSGGETTVTLKGNGKGGRNMELALSAAIELDNEPHILMLSAGTDGTDGPTDAAGAFAWGETLDLARRKGLSAQTYLDGNNSYEFFAPLKELLITGPTRTNVMDLQIILIEG